MSHHLLHLLSPNIFINKQNGLLNYVRGDERRQLPLEDIRGVIIATKGVTLTDAIISALLENGAFILHCNAQYQPIGLTEPTAKIVRRKVAQCQAKATQKLCKALWQRLLRQKIQNQRNTLKFIGCSTDYLDKQLNQNSLNESICARQYWRAMFIDLGYVGLTRRHDNEHDINKMLNYAYAVLGAICHRSIVAHGMSPLFGVHHTANFHNHPLVYDLIEPFRPFIDKQLWLFIKNGDSSVDLKNWLSFSKNCWQMTIHHNQRRLQLIDAVDVVVQKMAQAFQIKDSQALWLPEVP